MVAGALYELIHKMLGGLLRKQVLLPRQGRRPAHAPKLARISSPSSRPRKPAPINPLLVTILDRVTVRYA